MDRIDPLSGAPLPFYQPEKKKVEKKGPAKSVFSGLLESGRTEGTTPPEEMEVTDLESILDEIHQAGEALAEDPGMQKVMAYKRRIQAFLRYVVKETRKLEHQDGARLSIFKAPKRYTLISVVDRKLEQLAAGILQNQADKLEILQKVEEIQGILVDIVG